MPTVDKQTADILVKNNGRWPTKKGDMEDPQCVLIVEYDNAWGGIGYGTVYRRETNGYTASDYVRNPRTYWEYKEQK